MKDIKILVITGGFSNEREVSLRSGAGVFAALKKLNFTNIELFDLESIDSIKELIDKHQRQKYDLALLTTHGKYGEDGCLQGLLDIIGLKYTGSSQLASAVCMNKKLTKKILAANSLPTLQNYNSLEELIENKYILKPVADGSSVGVIKFNSKEDLVQHLTKNQIDLKQFIIERFVQGIEVTASIIDYDTNINNLRLAFIDSQYIFHEGKYTSLPLLELRPKKEFYDYEAKYTKGMTEFILPSSLEINLQKKIHKIAIEAYKVLELEGLARIDFIVDAASKEAFILEANTLPGMTELSDSPAQALYANLSYEDLVLLCIQQALPNFQNQIAFEKK